MEYPLKPVRAFIAVDLPDEIKKSISSLFGALDKTKLPVRTVSPENLHVTLKFLGGCRQDELEKVKAAMRSCAGAAEPFPLRFIGVGAFPSTRRPSVLWAGTEDKTGGLCGLLENLGESLLPDQEKERKPFIPHVTAARIKNNITSPDRKKIAQWLEENKDADFGRMIVRRLSLFQSSLSAGGASYSLLGGFDIPEKRSFI